MKIIFLNAWQGKVPQIKNFILDQLPSTDVFCFQEADGPNSPIFCQDYLSSDYQFFSVKKPSSQKDIMVQATFVKKSFSVLKTETVALNEKKIGLCLFTQIKNSDNQIFNILNVHGYPWPGDKQDNPDRIKQSQLIIDFMKNYPENQIVGGDFNLDSGIKSVKLFEESGYKNLIKEFCIGSTRNEISWEQYSESEKQHFADFLFLNSDLKITYFSVPYIEISDHLPMILEIN
jgi:endonuclease/exonuclease/phosphatase family metal-dependent hydrolase